MDAFSRYAPFIQDFIYRNGWNSLHAVQVAAADAIFNCQGNILLAASTASGKTEAAFFPMLTQIFEKPSISVDILYIAPLKALINDQFGRLNELCAQAEIPVWRWHGDVSAFRKAKLVKHPSGILQITPESLEALLLRKHSQIPHLFADLRFIVIDEIHSLMRSNRGAQTMCLIERMARQAGCRPRRVGLSATIGDLEEAGRFLAAGSGVGTIIERIDSARLDWLICMEHFYTGQSQHCDDDAHAKPMSDDECINMAELTELVQKNPGDAVFSPGVVAQHKDKTMLDTHAIYGHKDKVLSAACLTLSGKDNPASQSIYTTIGMAAADIAPAQADSGIGFIFEHTAGKKCLVFTNSREEAEGVCSTLRGYCSATGQPERFGIHHGNLSASYRAQAEDAMRENDEVTTIIATATLELGIDVGRLERAFQIDAPFSVSSFLQRLGRTGRRGRPPEMWFVMHEDRPEPGATIGNTMPWSLLQGIGLVQLYLEERWVESPRPVSLPYSLLYHQTLAILASQGEMMPAKLAERVLTLSAFEHVSLDDFGTLLRHMIATDQLQITEEGSLIVGIAGERVINDYHFYAVFVDAAEYTVRCQSQDLGTIGYVPRIGAKIAIAGRTWLVVEVDRRRQLVYCEQVAGQVPAYFGDCPGEIDTHILERMRRVLVEDSCYPYLMENARARLHQARAEARNAGITSRRLVHLGQDSWAFFPWLGTYAFLALERFLKIKCADELGLRAFDTTRPYFMQFRMRASHDEFWEIVARQAAKSFAPIELVYDGEVPIFEKYDAKLPEELVRKEFAEAVLDVGAMLKQVRRWAAVFECDMSR